MVVSSVFPEYDEPITKVFLFANPYRAAERGIVDEVIFPAETRNKLLIGFKMLENKAETLPKKKHGNIPL